MAPPKFADIGKKAKDLFKKQYDYKNEVKIISKAGVKTETTIGQGKGGLSGTVKANFTDEIFGDVEIEGGSGAIRGQFKKSKVIDGLDVTTSATASNVALESLYSHPNCTATKKVTYDHSKGSSAIAASLVFGMEGVAVGGTMDVKNGAVTDYNVGAQYSSKSFIAALFTASKGDDLTASYYQSVAKGTTIGASVTNASDDKRSFTVGAERALDKSTTFKIKANQTGIVDTAITHVLADPSLKINFAAQFDSKAGNGLAAQKCGVSFTFGDF